MGVKVVSELKKTRNRDSLVKLVPQLIQNILAVDQQLPARIIEAHAFGSVFRKSNPHDLDILLLHSQDAEQEYEWRRFRWIFSTGHGAVREDSVVGPWIQASFDLHKMLAKYYQGPYSDGMSLTEALSQLDVQRLAGKIGLNTLWAGCFSWTHYLHGEHGDGMFIPEIEKIFRKLVVGRLVQQGLQVHFLESSEFGKSVFRLSAIDKSTYVKVWDRNTAQDEVVNNFAAHYADEGLHRNEFLSLNKQVQEELSSIAGRIAELEKAIAERKVNISLKRLVSKHAYARIPITDSQLQGKSTELRERLKLLRATDGFLDSIETALGWGEKITPATLACDLLGGISTHEETVRRTLCRSIGLPEHEVVIDRTSGGRGMYANEAIYTRSAKKRSQIASEGDRYQRAHKLGLRVRHMLPSTAWDANVTLVTGKAKLPMRIGGACSRCVNRQTTIPVASITLKYRYPEGTNPVALCKKKTAGWKLRFDSFTKSFEAYQSLRVGVNEHSKALGDKVARTVATLQDALTSELEHSRLDRTS